MNSMKYDFDARDTVINDCTCAKVASCFRNWVDSQISGLRLNSIHNKQQNCKNYFNRDSTRIVWFRHRKKVFRQPLHFLPLYRNFYRLIITTSTQYQWCHNKLIFHKFSQQLLIKTFKLLITCFSSQLLIASFKISFVNLLRWNIIFA